jgi:hypothetical protein
MYVCVSVSVHRPGRIFGCYLRNRSRKQRGDCAVDADVSVEILQILELWPLNMWRSSDHLGIVTFVPTSVSKHHGFLAVVVPFTPSPSRTRVYPQSTNYARFSNTSKSSVRRDDRGSDNSPQQSLRVLRPLVRVPVLLCTVFWSSCYSTLSDVRGTREP